MTRGKVSEAQIIQRLRELAPGDFHWELVRLETNIFRVQFPTVEDLQRLLSFGMCKILGTEDILEFQEWKLVEPQGTPLIQAWLRFSGAPSELLRDAREVASLGLMGGKTERVDMDFTRAHGIARLLVSILDIDYVPDMVKWAFRGQVYTLEIQFEDDSLFAEAPAATGDDMSEGDDDTAGKEKMADDSVSEMAKRPEPTSKAAGGGTAPGASVPSTTLRFGSFGPASAPPRLWSERVESGEEIEFSLPPLDFAGTEVEGSGGPESLDIDSSTSACGDVAVVQAGGLTSSGSPDRDSLEAPSHPPVGEPSPRSPVAGRSPLADAQVRREGVGPVASTPPSASVPEGGAIFEMATCTPDRRSGVDGGRGQVAFSSPVLDSARSPRSPGGDRVDVRGVTGGRSPDKFSREEVIMFGGIPDQAAEGRRMSCRLQSHPEVDDMQQRCAVRAAKLREVQVTTGMSVNTSNTIMHFSHDQIVDKAHQLGISLGSNEGEVTNSVNDLLDLEAERALEVIRKLAAVKPMNDSEIDALGVRVLENFCDDLAPPLQEQEEDDENIGTQVDNPSITSTMDREGTSSPKRKWKRKTYPMSVVRRSARIRTAKKFHDEI